MNGVEVEAMPSLPGMCGAEIIPLLITLGLFLWGRSVADKHGTRGWRLASWMPIVAIVVHHLGIAGTVVGLVMSFGAVASVPAAERASALSDGIATAMWSTAIGLGLSLTLYLASVITFSIGSFRAPLADRAVTE
ncbi:MAG: MotA/TolQ/ExbB proton channel family protein [Deltaproteobacteria bacterium]|nr:MotA/TolQ/ExbB proton channel family protein [Deltaproteobacteria bacterium]